MDDRDLLEKFVDFLNEFYRDGLVKAANEGKKSINVDFTLLEKFDVSVADYLLENPGEVIPISQRAVKQIDVGYIEENFRVRFFNLPENRNIRIRNVRSEHIGKLIAIDGFVKRASEVRPEVSEAIFQCLECGSNINLTQTERIIRAPIECENPACKNRTAFKLVGQKLFDARWVVVEEPFEITEGERPSDLRVYLKEDLTTPKMQNKTDPGNRIKVSGILKELPRRMKGSASRQMEIYLEAVHCESVETEWEELDITSENVQKILELSKDPQIYDKFRDSIAPAIYGLEDVKNAIVLQLFGGQSHTLKDRSRVRGDIHLLLVGDPSCLVYDERVVMSDGTVLKIGEMGSKHLQDIDYDLHMGMGRKVGKADKFHIYRKQPIMEIVTETGKSVRGTYNQPVLVRMGVSLEWKRLDEIKIGDMVRVLPNIECRKKSLVETGWEDYPYHHKSWHIKIPEFVDKDLAGIFGYTIADGWVTKTRIGLVVNDEEMDIAEKLKEMFSKCFDAPVSSYAHKRASPKVRYFQVDRGHAAKLLSFLNDKRVPESIFQSGNDVVASFLSWLYEGDGSVFAKGRGSLSVSLKSSSIELLRDVQMLLLRFGIHSRILWESTPRTVTIKGRKIVSGSAGSLVIRRSESVIKFHRHIGFVSRKKKQKLENAAEYAKGHIHRIHKELSEKVVEINVLQPQDVFDVEVPKYNRFVANGVVVHNTAKSVLMKVVSGLIPRGKYVSGKGVTGAGLTATVVKDEEFLGGWVLEAGALVMANRSMCCLHPSMNFVSEKGLVKFSDLEKDIMWKKAKSASEIFEIGEMSQLLQSFNVKKLNVETSGSTLIRRKKFDGYLSELTLDSGNSLLLTSDHRLLDGDSLKWKPAIEFKKGDYVVAPLKLNSNSEAAYIFDLVPDGWMVCLTKEEKNELKNQILKRHKSLSEFNKKFYVDKNYLSGGRQLKKRAFQKIIRDLNVEIRWKSKNLRYGEHFSSRRLKISKATPELGYVLGFIYGDGHVNRKLGHTGFSVTQSTKHKKYTDRFMECFKTIFSEELHHRADNRVSSIRGREVVSNSDVLYFGSSILIQIFDSLFGRKLEKITSVPKDVLKGFIAGCFDSDGSISLKKSKGYKSIDVQFLLSNDKESMLNFMLGLRCLDVYSKLKHGRNVKGVIISDVKNAAILKDEISPYSEKIGKELPNRVHLVSSDSDKLPKYIISELSRSLANDIDTKILNARGISSLIYDYINLKYQPSRDQINKIIEKLRGDLNKEHLGKLEAVVKRDYFLDKIMKISKKKYKGYVYDLFVPKNHNLVSNGIFVHNCIDEFEKIDKSDQVALHEMMEQQTISIAKANIVATLPAMTTILAGGNPKLGRFDPYLPIKEQIDIPETILSRFDLKFALRDIPNAEIDAKVTEHILRARHFGEAEATPIVENEFFKKYVAYARKMCKPKLTREAADVLKEFYLSLRVRSGEESPIAITPRQYDALIRMAEASAKIQLREVVTQEDALRSINLMKSSLRQLGFDPETGMIDIDRAEGARTTASQRNKMRTLETLIEELEKTFGKNISRVDLTQRAKEQGIEGVEEIIDKMLREGYLFSGAPGIIGRV